MASCYFASIVKHAPGVRGATTPDLRWEEVGKSGRVGGLKAYFLAMSEEDRLQGRGETLRAVMEASGS